MNSKSDSRTRRAAKTRIRISQQDKPRLSVFKSSQNLYAQILIPLVQPFWCLLQQMKKKTKWLQTI